MAVNDVIALNGLSILVWVVFGLISLLQASAEREWGRYD